MLQNFGPRQIDVHEKEPSGSLPEVIAVTSGKGGVGKSSLSVNIAILLQQLKKKVLLIDADIHLGNVDLILGMRPRYTIADVISERVGMKEAIVSGPAGIDILPASSAVSELLELKDGVLQKIGETFSGFEYNYDLIILDTGAGISQNVMSFVFAAHKTVLVVTSDPSSIADAYAMIKVIRTTKPDMPILMVTNMVRNHEEGDSIYKKMNLMVRKFLNSGIDFGGAILRDELIAKSIKLQQPFVLQYPNSGPATALRLVNRKLLQLPGMDSSKREHFFKNFLENRKIEIRGPHE